MPLSDLRVALVGPGRVGTSLARWATARGATLTWVAASRASGADSLARELGAQPCAASDLSSEGLDLLLLAVPEPALEPLARSLALRPQADCALHTAGGSGAEVLEPLRAGGTRVGTLHPLKAFPRAAAGLAEADGIFLALDGDPEAIELGRRLASAWAARSGVVPAPKRPLYHLAASLAAGGVTTLLAVAAAIARAADLPAEVVGGYVELARGAVEAAGRVSTPAEAITGPVSRGEAETVEAQLGILREVLPELAATVEAVALETLRQVRASAPASQVEGRERLRRSLGSRSPRGRAEPSGSDSRNS